MSANRTSTGRRLLALATTFLTLAGLTAGVSVVADVQQADAATGRTRVEIFGRGWGHGRGMSQYGALGYVTDHGWDSSRILDHYYGGTVAGTAPVPGAVDPNLTRVDLVYMRGRTTTVTLGTGNIHLMDRNGATITTVGSGDGAAVRLTVNSGSTTIETGSDCNGPWSEVSTVAHDLVRVEAQGTNPAGSDPAHLLQVCGPSYRVWYDGEVWATRTSDGRRTINAVTIEQYLRGVVPNEMPAGWDVEALKVQAVAARSYALAGDHRWDGYADTCDTILCQVYDGRFTTRGSSFRSATHPRTDQALVETAGLVRLRSDGTVARTEFSSSTGGHTVDGDFPGVVDEGDDVSINPNHRWTVNADLTSLERTYGRGQVVGVRVSAWDGNGDDGGRADSVEVHFERGVVTLSGDRFRRSLGLKSNWFRFGSLTRGGTRIVDTARRDVVNKTFVRNAFERIEGRAPTDDELDRWTVQLRDRPRTDLTSELVAGQRFAGVMIDDLYQLALGRPSDAEGRRYWVETLGDGLKYEHLGTLFYGSPEYVKRSGGTDASFVRSLYVNILGRPADDEGLAYWVGLLADQRAGPADVANAFYRSIESRRDRSAVMYRRIHGRDADGDRVEDMAEQLLTIDDLALAADLAVDLTGETGGGS
jgi:SpoIID/LytB domain protein